MAKEGLTNEEEELIDRLIKAGIQKNTARTLVFVASQDEAKSREIEDATELRQPEVSISIQELRDHGWVSRRKIKKEGRGRPVHGYQLDKPMDEIIKEIEEKERERIAEIEENLEEIKELVGSCL